MKRTVAVLLILAGAACSRYHAGDVPEPKSPNVVLDQFLKAVKAKDTHAMANLWGNENGPWHNTRESYVDSVMFTFQLLLRHDTYKIVDGPLRQGSSDRIMTFHVELQAPGCTRTQPFDVIRTKAGGWLVYNVHLEAEGTVIPHCPRPGT